ncbi:hypothetical protein VIGAN_01304100, partial [Vigna angularis var. angularis]
PSPTSNCTANFATQLAKGRLSKTPQTLSFPISIKSPLFSDLCNSTSFSTNPSFTIASTASLRPKYPISNTHSNASTCSCKSREFNSAITLGISPFDSISSTRGDLIDLISEHNTSTE